MEQDYLSRPSGFKRKLLTKCELETKIAMLKVGLSALEGLTDKVALYRAVAIRSELRSLAKTLNHRVGKPYVGAEVKDRKKWWVVSMKGKKDDTEGRDGEVSGSDNAGDNVMSEVSGGVIQVEEELQCGVDGLDARHGAADVEEIGGV